MLNCKQCGRDRPGIEWPGQKCTDCYRFPVERHRYSDKSRTEPDAEYFDRAFLRVMEAKLMSLTCGGCGEKVAGHDAGHIPIA